MRSTFIRYVIVACLMIAVALSSGIAITAPKPMRLVCDVWPPYQAKAGDEVSGFSTEVIKTVYAEMGVPMAPVKAYPWKRALEFIQHGHVDGLFSANHTPERELYALFPDEMLVESPWVIWSRGSERINSLEDIKGKTIGVVMGYSYTEEFWKFIETYCVVDRVTTDEINFRKLENGRIFATVAEYGNGQHLVKKYGFDSIKAQREIVLKKDGLYLMFNRKTVSEDFVSKFSQKLKQFKQTQKYARLYEQYFGN